MVAMDEIDIDQEFIEQAKAEMAKDPKLRPCRMCYKYEDCLKRKRNTALYYGGSCFVTNEQLLRALILQDRARSRRQQMKVQEKLDVMNIMVSGADMIRDDIWDMIEAEYKRLEIKAKTDDATYEKNKRNSERLRKCYLQMKRSMQDFESQYRQFIGYWNAQMFEDGNGSWSPEFDKHTHNVGFLTYMMFVICEKLYMSEQNAERFIDFLNSMEGKDIWEEKDLKRYLIKI